MRDGSIWSREADWTADSRTLGVQLVHLNPSFPTSVRSLSWTPCFRSASDSPDMHLIMTTQVTTPQERALPEELVQWHPTYYNQKMGCELPYEENYQEILYRRFQDYFGLAAASKYEHAVVSIPFSKSLTVLTAVA